MKECDQPGEILARDYQHVVWVQTTWKRYMIYQATRCFLLLGGKIFVGF